ncbi:DUF4261 domain-containing protein, partial [bacterium]
VLYHAFVVLIGSAESGYYSCGMHNFGLADCRIGNHLPPAEAADFLNNFNYYVLIETPELGSGHTISLSGDGAVYRMDWEEDTKFEAEHAYHNPFGVWSLVRV